MNSKIECGIALDEKNQVFDRIASHVMAGGATKYLLEDGEIV